MEKRNFPKKYLENYFKLNFFKWIFVLGSVATLAACPGKNSGGGDTAIPVVISQNFAGLASPTALVNNGISNRGYDMQASWQIIGDASVMANAAYLPASTPYGNYVGPAIGRGSLVIRNQIGNVSVYPTPYNGYNPYNNNVANPCVLPAGTYTFDTITPGQMSQGMLVLPDLQATGPVTFRFALTNGGLNNLYGQDIVYGQVVITSINGAQCGNIGTYIN